MIFVPTNTPSSKNSKIITSRGLFHSKTVMKYLRNLGIQDFNSAKKTVKEYKDPNRINIFRKSFTDGNWVKPTGQAIIGFHFIRSSRHKFDFHNAVQIIADLIVAHDFIEDDNMDWFIPVPMKMNGKFYSYGKEDPGVCIKIFNN